LGKLTFRVRGWMLQVGAAEAVPGAIRAEKSTMSTVVMTTVRVFFERRISEVVPLAPARGAVVEVFMFLPF
jgi:hypothetical protein